MMPSNANHKITRHVCTTSNEFRIEADTNCIIRNAAHTLYEARQQAIKGCC